jgi:hypothetical protein
VLAIAWTWRLGPKSALVLGIPGNWPLARAASASTKVAPKSGLVTLRYRMYQLVSLHELLESGNIPVLAGMDKCQVIICLCSCSDLCRLCSHNRSTRFGEKQLCGSKFMLPEM